MSEYLQGKQPFVNKDGVIKFGNIDVDSKEELDTQTVVPDSFEKDEEAVDTETK